MLQKPYKIDVFLVGGGGGSGQDYTDGYSGAGGGYTQTYKRHPPEHNGTYLSELVATIQMGQQVPFQMEGEIIRHPEGIDQDNTGQTADPVEVEPVNILFTPVMVDQMDQKVRTLEKLVLRQGL